MADTIYFFVSYHNGFMYSWHCPVGYTLTEDAGDIISDMVDGKACYVLPCEVSDLPSLNRQLADLGHKTDDGRQLNAIVLFSSEVTRAICQSEGE